MQDDSVRQERQESAAPEPCVASDGELETMADLIAKVVHAQTNGRALKHIAEYRLSVIRADRARFAAPQAAPAEPLLLDAIRQAIEERDEIEQRYHDLAEHLVYEGNSVSFWRSKAIAYRDAIDNVWTALKAAGVRADGKKTCADGVRELAATLGAEPQEGNQA